GKTSKSRTLVAMTPGARKRNELLLTDRGQSVYRIVFGMKQSMVGDRFQWKRVRRPVQLETGPTLGCFSIRHDERLFAKAQWGRCPADPPRLITVSGENNAITDENLHFSRKIRMELVGAFALEQQISAPLNIGRYSERPDIVF